MPCALPFNDPEPKVVVPSMNVTVPVGTVGFPVGPETVAVNVTDWPCPEGFTEDATAVVEVSFAGALTTWVRAFDVDPLKFESPP